MGVCMSYDQNNIFARIVRGEIPAARLFENTHALAFKDINPKTPVHVLVIPKGFYRTMDEFAAQASDAEILDFTRAVGAVIKLSGLEDGGYRLISNNGPDGGQEVPHYHVHVLAGRHMPHMLPET